MFSLLVMRECGNKAIEASLQGKVDCKSRLNFVLRFGTKELIPETISQLTTHL